MMPSVSVSPTAPFAPKGLTNRSHPVPVLAETAHRSAASRATVQVPWAPRYLVAALMATADLLVLSMLALGVRAAFQVPGPSLVVATVALLVLIGLNGLYQQAAQHPVHVMQRMAMLTLVLSVVAALSVGLATGSTEQALELMVWGLMATLVLPFTHGLVRILLAQQSWWGIPAVIINRSQSAPAVLDTLRRWPELGIRPVALVGDALPDDASAAASVPYGGAEAEALHLATTHKIPYVVVALPHVQAVDRARLIERYSRFFDKVFIVPVAGEGPALWTTGATADGLMGVGIRRYALRPLARAAKRTVDVVGSAILLVLLAPIVALVALLIKRDDPGPVFYRQHRMGRDGRCFSVLKFRTMYTNADAMLREVLLRDDALRAEYQRFHKLQNDPRVTPIGRVLRRYSLDELPQLWNVLRGDMSLVGPRAYMPGELHEMQGLARCVLQTPPGITGLWQVSGRNHLSFEARVHLDVHYIQHWSPWLDLYLLARTAPVVLRGDGAC